MIQEKLADKMTTCWGDGAQHEHFWGRRSDEASENGGIILITGPRMVWIGKRMVG
jgi:hypothetical protein